MASPAGPADEERVARGLALLRSWGFEPCLMPGALAGGTYLAGSDASRLGDLVSAFRDPSVRAVVATRGGYGTQRIVDRVPFSLLRSDPKLLVGFSDLTALHLAAWRRCRLASCYGPGVAWDPVRLPEHAAASLRAAMTDAGSPLVLAGRGVASGSAAGVLLGGNLSLVAASVGTRDLPDLAGAILLIEEVDEAPYRIDRMLTQLLRAGALAGLTGVAIGQLTNCGDDALAVIVERLAGLGVPMLAGLSVGHGRGQLTVPLGTPARLDTAAGTLCVEPAVS